MTDTRHNHSLLAQRIRQLFADGLAVGPDVVHYLDSTLSGHDASTLETVMNDPANCERDPLIELLYFPDEFTQTRLEDFLESAVFTLDDEAAVLTLLQADPTETAFFFPGLENGWKIPTPEAGAEAFLRHLRISHNPDRRLVAAIASKIPKSEQNRCKVGIRNADIPAHESRIVSLERFLLKSDAGNAAFFDRFHFFLQFLAEWKEGSDLWDALTHKKHLYSRQLQQAQQAEARRQNRNVETLMMMGIRLPHTDRMEIAAKIAMIDDIALAIFGRSVYVNDGVLP